MLFLHARQCDPITSQAVQACLHHLPRSCMIADKGDYGGDKLGVSFIGSFSTNDVCSAPKFVMFKVIASFSKPASALA
eukprot:3505851-Amphidinium_carterae.1